MSLSDDGSPDAFEMPGAPGVYVRYERARHGFSWRLKNPDLPEIEHEEIAFRPEEVTKNWRRFHKVCAHVARRALQQRGG